MGVHTAYEPGDVLLIAETLKEGIITDESIAETLEVGPDGLFIDKKVLNGNYIPVPQVLACDLFAGWWRDYGNKRK